MAASTFQLNEVRRDPRTGAPYWLPHDEYKSLAAAKKAAKQNMKGRAWVITELRIVAQSEDEA